MSLWTLVKYFNRICARVCVWQYFHLFLHVCACVHALSNIELIEMHKAGPSKKSINTSITIWDVHFQYRNIKQAKCVHSAKQSCMTIETGYRYGYRYGYVQYSQSCLQDVFRESWSAFGWWVKNGWFGHCIVSLCLASSSAVLPNNYWHTKRFIDKYISMWCNVQMTAATSKLCKYI